MITGTTAVSLQREPELFGQTVVVIGGTAGIGLETARRARAEGASVILTGRNPERLKQAARELDAQRTAAFDASDPASLQAFFRDLPSPIDHVRRIRRHTPLGITPRRRPRQAARGAARGVAHPARRWTGGRCRAGRSHHEQYGTNGRDLRHRRATIAWRYCPMSGLGHQRSF